MTERSAAESRLVAAAAAAGLADPRPSYRERLRTLKQTDRSAFDRAVAHYEQTTLPALEGDEPLSAWLDYGRFLAGLTAEGAVKVVDTSGRARSLNGADLTAALVLFIPGDNSADVMTLLEPADPTPAQRATVGLLVERRLALL